LNFAGRSEEARAEVAEILQLDLNFSLEKVKQNPFNDQAVLDRWLTDLRKAGLK
ncbi:MAG: hypothetical protein HY268_15915, partial [Deltaproteobacteria bacterium]|nr:hypothetical protein [Deltaproteobacteria bacterium]